MSANVLTIRGTNETMATEWYYRVMNDVIGPVNSRDLLDKVRSGHIKHDTLVRKDDSQWVPASQVSGLLDAAGNSETRRICPYCGHAVERPPTTCDGCNRKLVLSVSSRLTSIGKGKSHQPKKNREQEAEDLREKMDRQEIIRYLALLVLWVGLLLGAPYLTYLASSGRLVFEGHLTVFSVLGVSLLVAGLYLLISRLT